MAETNTHKASGWTCSLCTTSAQPSSVQPHQPAPSTTTSSTTQSTSISTAAALSSVPSFPPASASTLRILQINLAGLRSRQVELLKFLQDEQIDITCMQETNLGGGAEPPRLSGWQLVGRRDRKINRDGQVTSTHHGGVAFLVREGVYTRTSQMLPLQLSRQTTTRRNVRQ